MDTESECRQCITSPCLHYVLVPSVVQCNDKEGELLATKGIVWRFGKYTYLLSWCEIDEKTDTMGHGRLSKFSIKNIKYRDGRSIPDYFDIRSSTSTMTTSVETFMIAMVGSIQYLLSEKKGWEVLKLLNLVLNFSFWDCKFWFVQELLGYEIAI